MTYPGELDDELDDTIEAVRMKQNNQLSKPELVRVDGGYQCEICNKEAKDHPQSKIFPFPTFVKLCDGREVKI